MCRERRHGNLVREPDAGNPPVRFDEREVETEQGETLRHRQPKGPAPATVHLNHRATSRLYFLIFSLRLTFEAKPGSLVAGYDMPQWDTPTLS